MSLFGSGTALTKTLTPASSSELAFGPVPVGTTSAAKTLQLTNSGNSAVSVTSIDTAEGNGFNVSHDCGTSVAPTSSCTVTVTFSPSKANDRAGVLSIASNGSVPSVEIDMSGTGTQGALSADLTVDFGGRLVGSSTPLNYTLTNGGNGNLSMTVPSAASVSGAGFSFVSTTCGAVLVTDESCTVVLSFAPATSGAQSGTLALDGQSTELLGTGLQGLALFSPTSLSFAPQDVTTTSAAQNVTVTNQGTAPLFISGVSVDLGLANFNQSNNCLAPLGIGQSCAIAVAMAPSTSGALTGRVLVGNDGSGGAGVIALDGSGQLLASMLSNFTVPPQLYGTGSFTIPGPTSLSSGQIQYTSSNPAVATVSADTQVCVLAACTTTFGNALNMVGVGSTTITATQFASGNYAGGTISATFNVTPGVPTLGSLSLAGKSGGDAPYALTSPTSSGSGAWSYTSSNSAVATISGSTVTVVGAGSTTITATQAASALYQSATTAGTLTVTVVPTQGALTLANKQLGDAAFVLTAPTSDSPGAWSYSSSNPTVATLVGNTVTIVASGSTTITATQAATGNFASKSTSASFTVLSGPSLGAFANQIKQAGTAPFSLTQPTSNSAGAWSYTSSNSAVATISCSTVTIVAAGSATITATQAANGLYSAGTTTATLTVTQGILSMAASIPFGNTLVGISTPAILTVTNTGNGALALTVPTVTTNAAEFSVTSGSTTCTTSLAVAQSCNVVMSMTPTAGGARSGILTLNGQTVSLSGSGTLANGQFIGARHGDQTNTGARLAIAAPSGTQNGDMMVMFVTDVGSISAPSGWTQAASLTWTLGYKSYVFTKIANAEGSNYLVGASATETIVSIVTYRNVTAVDAVSSANTGPTGYTYPSVNASATNRTLVTYAADRSPTIPTIPSGLLSRDAMLGTYFGVRVADELLMSAGATGIRAGYGGSVYQGVTFMVTLK